MQLRASTQLVRVSGLRARTLVTRSYQQNEPGSYEPASVVGDKVGKWMLTPFDLLAFGPRATAGALISAPERLQTLQSDLQRLVELVQDPRPLEEKQSVLMKEMETTVLEFLEKGTIVEQDVLSNLKSALPADAAQMLSELIPEPPNKDFQSGPTVPVEPEYRSDAPTVMYGSQDVVAVQAAGEVAQVRSAVAGLRAALDAVKDNMDVAGAPMLRVNLRDARDQLARRLDEAAPHAAGPLAEPDVAAAQREANILLNEVDAVFFSS
mmetsp:Transcript_13897/g.24359  ORF Transcript_13897/g.24359 Transcript_13897/m.24359 type:complete len:266 (+) Transcript_13897:86-883(+)|eukprot:CAMPEP_0119108578 /NCGR_PEP_ID=MMETSP1180-20130426/15187_1 /TAXON_ID=3052 ORGANISM="Chlamydomonas cf sp, Strain CCMP681" /NCGR_SAMPLE_ID=MMETSP1180 /ASSEMBLY_ACC=CAM_ASM_000741 /LENGTH=265 /DNA_ID=CAMNT_0007094203 /DNA_START=75 /DNA_END=872 /DNA_ORIENTATION=+